MAIHKYSQARPSAADLSHWQFYAECGMVSWTNAMCYAEGTVGRKTTQFPAYLPSNVMTVKDIVDKITGSKPSMVPDCKHLTTASKERRDSEEKEHRRMVRHYKVCVADNHTAKEKHISKRDN